jgi:hypothetical protein
MTQVMAVPAVSHVRTQPQSGVERIPTIWDFDRGPDPKHVLAVPGKIGASRDFEEMEEKLSQ